MHAEDASYPGEGGGAGRVVPRNLEHQLWIGYGENDLTVSCIRLHACVQNLHIHLLRESFM